MKTDFLVIGSGIAGLSYALKVAKNNPEKKVVIITKSNEEESNTKYAQGGIAIVWDKNDSFEKHIEDTMIAGDWLCNKEIVELVVKTAPDRLREMVEWGANFDKNSEEKFDLGLEGGHSENRIIHHKDTSGLEMEKTLLRQIHKTKNIEVLEHHFAIDLITEHHLYGKEVSLDSEITCYGIYAMNLKTMNIDTISAKITMIATGGLGQAYKNTVNPVIATGDGVAMAYRAKARIKDMEFVQFHPTGLYNPGETPSFLISEAVRGFGGILKTQDGSEFMNKYDSRKELASRDIVARGIDSEMKKRGEDFVYLDCRHLDMKKFKEHFPNITEKCQSIGIDVEKDMIPVVPTAHFLCGGIATNENGETTIKNLYAAGECACTGLHGGNRLASNSLLEGLVFGHQASEEATKQINKIENVGNIPSWNTEGTTEPKEKVLISHNRKELQNVMSDFVGIVRSNERLEKALKRIEVIYKETEKLYDKTILSPQLCELRNLIAVSNLIIKQSIQRKENKGGFYNIDLV